MDRGDCSCAAARLHDHKVVASYLKLFFPLQTVGKTRAQFFVAQKTGDLWEQRTRGCAGAAHVSRAITIGNMKCCCFVAGGQPGWSLPWTIRGKIHSFFAFAVCPKLGIRSRSFLPGICYILGYCHSHHL